MSLSDVSPSSLTVGVDVVGAAPAGAVTEAAVPLRLVDVGLRFGGVQALSGVNWQLLGPGRYGLIGPNGAGKSTLFNVISGLYAPSSGSVHVAGQSTMGLPTYAIARLGVARTFQNIRLLPQLSVLDNLRVVAAHERRGTFWSSFCGGARARTQLAAIDARARALLAAVELTDCAEQLPTTLSYGAQRRLEIARAMMRQPRLLMLDEPAAGMNATEKLRLADILRQLIPATTTLVVVEHDMPFIMALCTSITVMHQGQIFLTGSPAQIQADPGVASIYLGTAVS